MFTPKFSVISANRYTAADIINRPHEDYPNRVQVTVDTIKWLVYHGSFYYGGRLVTDEYTILEAHKYIMHDTDHAGKFRACQVMIGQNDRGIDYWEIPSAMARIDVYLNNTELMQEWYKAFQQIHPFEDGNGRVAGAIVAAASFLYFGDRMLVPQQ